MCEKEGCPKCETVCSPAKCHTKCVAPEPKCNPVCEETKCDWKCKKPTTCPKPSATPSASLPSPSATPSVKRPSATGSARSPPPAPSQVPLQVRRSRAQVQPRL